MKSTTLILVLTGCSALALAQGQGGVAGAAGNNPSAPSTAPGTTAPPPSAPPLTAEEIKARRHNAALRLKAIRGAEEQGVEVRIKDVARFRGVRSNQLQGIGLLVGLDGTGDTKNT